MGHQPIPPAAPPTRESFHLGSARRAYVSGELTIEEFERSVEHVLEGGHLDAGGRIPVRHVLRKDEAGEWKHAVVEG